MAAHRDYLAHSRWKDETFTCSCGWAGVAKSMPMEMFRELAEYSCPRCDTSLFLVSYPTSDEIKSAAAAGNEAAEALLPEILERERRDSEWEREALRDAQQLPEVQGSKIAFVWDIEQGASDSYYVIKAGEQVVWRELARWEDWERFDEVKAVLKKRYGTRFASLTPTHGAVANLLGDDTRAILDPE